MPLGVQRTVARLQRQVDDVTPKGASSSAFTAASSALAILLEGEARRTQVVIELQWLGHLGRLLA